MKITGLIVLGLVLSLFALWWGLLRAPGPTQVCDHILEVTLHEAGDQALSHQSQQRLLESTRSSCVEHKRNKLQLRGRIKYAEYAKCVVASRTLIDIGRC